MYTNEKTEVSVQIDIDSTQVMMVHKAEFKGNEYLAIQKFYEKDGELKPGKGFLVPHSEANARAVLDALGQYIDMVWGG